MTHGHGRPGDADRGQGPEVRGALRALVSRLRVADLDGLVVGLTGLLDRGTSGEVEPVVVAERLRGRGVGRLLIERVVTEAVARGYDYLAIRPVARNVSAIRRFYDAGFQALGGHVDLTMDLAGRRHGWLEGARLHGLDFRY